MDLNELTSLIEIYKIVEDEVYLTNKKDKSYKLIVVATTEFPKGFLDTWQKVADWAQKHKNAEDVSLEALYEAYHTIYRVYPDGLDEDNAFNQILEATQED